MYSSLGGDVQDCMCQETHTKCRTVMKEEILRIIMEKSLKTSTKLKVKVVPKHSIMLLWQ